LKRNQIKQFSKENRYETFLFHNPARASYRLHRDGRKGGYDVATDQRSVEKQIDDAGIRGQIEKDLQQSSVESTDKISVFCHNGIVVLTGVVAVGSGADTEAVKIARQVQGVKKVETYFLPSQQSRISDFEIKEKIYFKMVGDSDLKADQVDMTVIDGHVVLIGMVSSSAKVRRVMAIAHATKGVKAVKSFIQVVQ
jgi:osmotically-inducible protein OsmY